MFRWLKKFYREYNRFDLPGKMRALPRCRFRPYRPSDFEFCAGIYQLNEPDRFPPGYSGLFAEWLQSGRDLVLVCEVDGAIRGFGGVGMHQAPPDHYAFLNFGMIHPGFHRQGYGTALLLARLAILPSPGLPGWEVIITTTGNSESFYGRFGFTYSARYCDELGTEFDRYHMRLYDKDRETCRRILERAVIPMDAADGSIPNSPRLLVAGGPVLQEVPPLQP